MSSKTLSFLSTLRLSLLAVFLFSGLGGAAFGASQVSSAAGVPVELAAAARYSFGQDRAPLQTAEQWLRGLDTPARRDAERVLLAQLGSGSLPDGAMDFMLRSLALVGGQESVGSLVGLLSHPKWGSVALNSLVAIPEPEAELAMIRAISSSRSGVRLALISVMARRRSTAAVSALRVQISNEEEAVAAAALEALGAIASTEAFEALRDTPVVPTLTLVRVRALTTLTSRMGEGAGVPVALRPALTKLCRQLLVGQYEEQVRISALRSLVKLAGGEAAPELLSALVAPSVTIRRSAAQCLSQSLSSVLVSSVLARWADFDPAVRLIIMDGLADHGDRSTHALALSVLEDRGAPEKLRASALRALGVAGNAEDFGRLFSFVYAQDDLAPIAAAALARMKDSGVDILIRKSLATAAPALASVLLEIAANRADKQVFDFAFRQLEAGGATDAGLRASAAEAIAILAEPQDLPRLVAALLLLNRPPEFRSFEKALQVLAPAYVQPEEAAAMLIQAVQTATAPQKKVLRTTLASMDTPPAIHFLKKDLSSGDKELWRETVRAMANSKLFAHVGTLLEEIRGAKGDDRLFALRSLFLLLKQTSRIDGSLRADAYVQAWPFAERDEERQVVLSELVWIRPEAAAALRAAQR